MNSLYSDLWKVRYQRLFWISPIFCHRYVLLFNSEDSYFVYISICTEGTAGLTLGWWQWLSLSRGGGAVVVQFWMILIFSLYVQVVWIFNNDCVLITRSEQIDTILNYNMVYWCRFILASLPSSVFSDAGSLKWAKRAYFHHRNGKCYKQRDSIFQGGG